MKNFLIIPNRQKDTGLALTSHIKDTLIGMGPSVTFMTDIIMM